MLLDELSCQLFNHMNSHPLHKDVFYGESKVKNKKKAGNLSKNRNTLFCSDLIGNDTSWAIHEVKPEKEEIANSCHPPIKSESQNVPSTHEKENYDKQGSNYKADVEATINTVGDSIGRKTAIALRKCSGLGEYQWNNSKNNDIRDNEINELNRHRASTPTLNSKITETAPVSNTKAQNRCHRSLHKNVLSETYQQKPPNEHDSFGKTVLASDGESSNEINYDTKDTSLVSRTTKSHLTVLVFNGMYDYVQTANQKAALSLLDDLNIPYKIVDGMNPSNREERDFFVNISGIPGNCPQLFLPIGCGNYDYLGGFDWLQSCNVNDLTKMVWAQQRTSLSNTIEYESTSDINNNFRCNVQSPCTSSNVGATKAHLTLVVSNGVFDYIQAANQKAARSLLDDLRIPYDIVDGMDPSQREKRDQFFQISGIRGNYPQIFLSDGNKNTFLGGYDWLQKCNIGDFTKIVMNQEQTISTVSESVVFSCETLQGTI